MEKLGWKITAIVFISLFVLGIGLIGWGMSMNAKELDKTNTCYYDTCGEYVDAYFEGGICSCYDYDVMGQLIVVKQIYLK